MPTSDSENARDREQHRPVLESAAFFGDRQRMQQRGADEPRHERRVLDRVPEPPAAPAQRVVRPPAADHDADGEEAPRERRPGPRPARPRRVETAAQQRGDGECEGDREADVAHVQHRRVRDHSRILQQRIQVAAVGGHREQPLERVRGEQHEKQEAEAHEAHHAEHAGDHFVGQVTALERDRERPDREHEHPQQHRALVRAPRRREAVVDRQLRIRIGGDVQHREVADDERVRKATPRGDHEQDQALRHGPRETRPRGNAPRGADDRQGAEDEREQQGEDQREVTEFGNHGGRPAVIAAESWRPSRPRRWCRAPFSPRRRLRAACSSRRASRALRSRGRCRRARSGPAPRRLFLP